MYKLANQMISFWKWEVFMVEMVLGLGIISTIGQFLSQILVIPVCLEMIVVLVNDEVGKLNLMTL